MIQNLPNFIERGKDIELIIIVHSFLKAQNRFYLFQPIPYCITVLKEHLCCQGNISVAFYISKYCFQQIGMMTFVVFGEQSFNIIVKLLYPSVVAQSAKKLVNSDLAEIKQSSLLMTEVAQAYMLSQMLAGRVLSDSRGVLIPIRKSIRSKLSR